MLTAIPSFDFHMPTQIEYGLDKFKSIGKILSGLGKKALIVSYENNSLKDLTKECRILLKEEGVIIIRRLIIIRMMIIIIMIPVFSK